MATLTYPLMRLSTWNTLMRLTYGTGEMGDAVGTLGFPEWRSNAYVNWNLNNWSANLALDYIGESKERIGDEQVSTRGTR